MADQATPATPQDTPAPPPQAAVSYPKVLFKGEVEIFPDKPLPHLNRGAVKAYTAKGKKDEKYFALVCENNLVPQIDMVPKYMGLVVSHLPRLIGFSTVRWPIDKKEHAVFIYENKLGKPVTEGRSPNCLGLKPELVLNTIFRKLIETIQVMREINFFHGAINPTNIYEGSSEGFENAMLGEMLSSPSGFTQPVLYETIGRGVADPLGRGQGSLADDLYAFGVTLAVLIRSHDPMQGLTDAEVIARKIEISSFNAIVGQERFPGPVLELLRGLLHDIESQRWTYDDILIWMEGRRVPAKLAVFAISKASRPLEFCHNKYLRPQHLALDLCKDTPAAAQIVDTNELGTWLNRSVQNKEFETRLDESIERARKETSTSHHVDRLAAYVSVALAQGYPFMYRGLKFYPAGFGALLVDAVVNKNDVNPFVEVIQGEMVAFWAKYNLEQNHASLDSMNRIGSCQSILRQSSIGYGIERCIYMLSPMVHCLSDKLDGFFVRSPEDYVRALEVLSKSNDRPEWFLDRHIIAFLCVRDKAIIEPYMADLNATERHRQRYAVLRIFAAIQQREKIESLPGLSAWMVGLLDVLVDRYHDRSERERVSDQLEKVKGKGDLTKIVDVLGSYDRIQNDMRGFGLAMRQFQALKNDFHRLQFALEHDKDFGVDTGKQAAMVVSGIIAGIVVFVYLFFNFMGS